MQLRIFAAPPPVLRPRRTPVEVPPLPVILSRRARGTCPPPALAAPPPVSAAPAAAAAVAAPVAEVALPALDHAALAVLASAAAHGESVAASYARKERELADLFTTLTTADALALHARLAACAEGDALATQFHRLVAERRARLLALLASAGRRAGRKATANG